MRADLQRFYPLAFEHQGWQLHRLAQHLAGTGLTLHGRSKKAELLDVEINSAHWYLHALDPPLGVCQSLRLPKPWAARREALNYA
jgi:hypothetical protein